MIVRVRVSPMAMLERQGKGILALKVRVGVVSVSVRGSVSVSASVRKEGGASLHLRYESLVLGLLVLV